MRLTREKIVRLSHQITDVLVESEEVEFVDDRDTIRQQVVQILTATLKDEEKIELEVRKRITSQKKEILEGSEEWDILHKRAVVRFPWPVEGGTAGALAIGDWKSECFGPRKPGHAAQNGLRATRA